MKKIILIFLVLFLLDSISFSKNQEIAWLLERNPSARLKSLGGAGVAINDMSSSLYVNPAVMSYDPHGRLSIFYGYLPKASHFGYLEYIYPFSSFGSLGAGIESRIKNSENYQQNYLFGLALRPFKGFSFGLTGKVILKTFLNDYAEDFGLDAGAHITLFKWLNFGSKIENIKSPLLEYENIGLTEEASINLQNGINILNERYFNLIFDVYTIDMDEKFGSRKHLLNYGIEIFPDPALAIRAGNFEDKLRFGLGIVSRKMDFDYSLVTEYDDLVHFLQLTFKFGMTPSRKEVELKKREEEITRESLYYEGLLYLNMGEVAAARGKVNTYKNKFGNDDKIMRLENDINRWLNKMREEKFGKAEEFKKDILKDFYQGNLEQAVIKLDNLKLIAPSYEGVLYLEHILAAGLLLEEGKYTDAEDNLINALKIDPDSKEVRDLYSRLKEVMRLSE